MTVFHTSRLRLRPITADDIDAMLATRTIPEVVAFTYEPLWTRDYAEERVAMYVALQQQTEVSFTRWMIEIIATGEVVGDVYLSKDAELRGTTEVGYVIHPDYAGNGYATEATREALRIGFEEWGVHRIYARVDADNVGSIRVCQHLGMRQEGRLIENDMRGDQWSTERVFAMLDREWNDRKIAVQSSPPGLVLLPNAEYYASLPRRRMAAGQLFTNPAGEILLVETTYKPNWEIPGGICDAGESPRTAARREGREEIGIDAEPGALLIVDHQSDDPPKGDMILFVYDGGVLDDASTITIDHVEIAAVHFVSPDELDLFTKPEMATRLRAALRARAEQRVIEI